MVGTNIFKYFILASLFFAITVPVDCINIDDITTTPNSTPPTTVEGIDDTTTSNYIDYDYNSTDDAFPPQPKYNCEGKICVTKCCPKGSLFDYEKQCSNNVEDYNTSDWKPKFETELGDKLFVISKIPSLPEEEKYATYICAIYASDEFTLREDGTVYVMSMEQTLNHDFYCIDNMYGDGALAIAGVICYDDADAGTTNNFDKLHLGGLCISCISLTLLLFVHCIAAPFKRDLQAKCTISSCISLLFGFLLSIFNMVPDLLHSLTLDQCVVLGICSQFFLLSFYFWLNVMCYEISRIIRGTVKMQSYRDLMKSESRYLCYCAYAWGLPLLVCVVTITLQYLPEFSSEVEGYIIRPGIGIKRCWFLEDSGAVYAYYYCIEITLHVVNTLFMAHTTFLINRDKLACLCCQSHKGTSIQLRTHNSTNYLAMFKQQLMIYILYIFIWGLNAITLFGPEAGVSRIIDVTVSLQGLFLFMIVVVPKKSSLLLQAYEKVSDLVKEFSTRISTKKIRQIRVLSESSESRNEESPL